MKIHLGAAAGVALAAVLAACGGGGGGGGIPVAPTPGLPISSQATVALSSSATSQATFGTISNGSSATVTFPATSGAANANLSLTSKLPFGATQPQLLRGGSRIPSAIGGSNLSVLDYVIVSVDANVSIAATPAFVFHLANPIATGTSAYIAVLDLNNLKAGWNLIDGPATASGSTLTFASTTLAPALALAANDFYVFALVTGTGIATPTPLPPYPGAAGSTFGFTGAQTQADTYTYPTPSPLPNTSVTSQVTQNITISATPFPNGTPSTTDFHAVTTVAAPLASQITTTDAWYGATTAGTNSALAVGLYGQTSVDNATNAMTVLYGSPQVSDLLVETNGATWTNSPAGTTNTKFADGETLTRTDNADGSYTETTTTSTLHHSYTFIAASSADGSGSYTGTGLSAFGVASITAAAPSAGTITVSVLPVGSTAPPIPIAAPKAWFTPGSKLYSENDSETTAVAFPATCSVPAQFGWTGGHISQTIERIDPIIGTDEKIQNDIYTSLFGPVCSTMSDTLTENYDYLIDASLPFPFSGNPNSYADFSGNAVHVRTTTETLTLASASLKSAARGAQAMSISPSAILGARAQFALNAAVQRHKVVSAAIKRIQAAILKGGLK